MRTALLISLVGLLVASAYGEDDFNDDEVSRDSASLQQLLREVRNTLPSTWQAEITPDIPEDFVNVSLRDVPLLVVWRKEKVLAEYNGPGRPVRHKNPSYKPVQLCFRLWFTEYLALQEYRQIANDNANRERRRIKFEKPLMRDIACAWKGSEPIPPQAFHPETSEQKERVRRYALLWMRTELKPLPTHQYQTLACTLVSQDYFAPKDKSVGDELENVRKAILDLVTEYPTKPEIEKGGTN